MAPILSFTAEEAWKVLKRKTDGTIFAKRFLRCRRWPTKPRWSTSGRGCARCAPTCRNSSSRLRERGDIGSSLQAEVEVRTNAETAALLQSLGDELKFVLITSAARVTQVEEQAMRR